MKTSFASAFAIFSIVVLLAFPKAGLYMGRVPLTVGYMLLALAGMAQLISVARSGRGKVRMDYLCLGTLFFVLGIVEAASFSYYGYLSVGNATSIVISTIVVPILAILSANWFLDVLGWERFFRTLKWSLSIVFAFGIISFLAYNVTGKLIGIPYLTTTGNNISLVAERHNLRGSIIKMFSTYNNGNILGINLLLWGALAASASKSSAFQFRSLCVLTLSRSVWLGLATFELANSIMRRSLQRVFYASAFVALLGLVAVGATLWMGRDPSEFFLDADLGGRVTSLKKELSGISTQKLAWNNESLYAAAYLAFGPIGVVMITSAWFLPIIRGGRSPIEIRCRLILFIYMFIAGVEAAFNLVPTQASYWLIAGIAMSGHASLPASEEQPQDEKSTGPGNEQGAQPPSIDYDDQGLQSYSRHESRSPNRRRSA